MIEQRLADQCAAAMASTWAEMVALAATMARAVEPALAVAADFARHMESRGW